MYHPYIEPYSVLPKLRKMRDDEPIFQFDENYFRYIRAKNDVKHEPRHLCIKSQKDYDVISHIEKWMNTRLGMSSWILSQFAYFIQEDIVIQKIESDKDWMMACHVCLPSGWKPEEEIGKSFAQLHEKIPGFPNNPQLVKSMLKGPLERFLWTVRFDDTIQGYPGTFNTEWKGQDNIWIRVERQVFVPFPEVDACLFLIRIYIVKPDLSALKQTIRGMSPEILAWKEYHPKFMEWVND